MRPAVRVVDLFCGCGGLSLGVAEAARRLGLGIEIPLAVDADEDAVAVYRANFADADVRSQLVEQSIDGENGSPLTSRERRLARAVGPVDVLIGGPPCQGHSDLNNHTRRNDPRNALYARMARAARVLRPSLVLIENVPAVQHDTKKVVDVTVEALRRAGYVVDYRVVDLTLLGIPQRRRRHVVLASRRDEVVPTDVLDALHVRCLEHPVRTVRWGIEDLLDSTNDGIYDTASTPTDENRKRIQWLLARDRYDLPNRLRPDCHASDHSYNSMYGRLAWDSPAQTVTTGFGSMGQGRYVHPARPRTITPHEAARLQMLPDFVDLSAVQSRKALARLIGNAVPPVLATAICEPALRALIDRESTAVGATTGIRTRRKASASEQPNGSGPPDSGPSSGRGHRSMKTPPASSDAARSRMRATRQRDTAAERLVQLELNRLGVTYAVDASPLLDSRRRADIVFADTKVAVYVDGCFWHGCPTHGTSAKSNGQWWREKLERNQLRDRDTSRQLHDRGWMVLRFWEHEDAKDTAAAIETMVSARMHDVASSIGR